MAFNKNNIRNFYLEQAKDKLIDSNKPAVSNNFIKPNIFIDQVQPNQGKMFSDFPQPIYTPLPNNVMQNHPRLLGFHYNNPRNTLEKKNIFLNKKIEKADDLEIQINSDINIEYVSPSKNKINKKSTSTPSKTLSNPKFKRNIKLEKRVSEFDLYDDDNHGDRRMINSNQIERFLSKEADFFNLFDCDVASTLHISYLKEIFPKTSTNDYLLLGDNHHNNSILIQYFIASVINKFKESSSLQLFEDHIKLDNNKVSLEADFSQYKSELFKYLKVFNSNFNYNFTSVSDLLRKINSLKKTPPQQLLSFTRFIYIYYRIVLINYIKYTSHTYNNILYFKDEFDFKNKVLDCTSSFLLDKAEIIIHILNKALNTNFDERLMSLKEVDRNVENFCFLKEKDKLFLIIPDKYI